MFRCKQLAWRIAAAMLFTAALTRDSNIAFHIYYIYVCIKVILA